MDGAKPNMIGRLVEARKASKVTDETKPPEQPGKQSPDPTPTPEPKPDPVKAQVTEIPVANKGEKPDTPSPENPPKKKQRGGLSKLFLGG